MVAQSYYLYKFNRYGKKVNSCDLLKFLALMLMILDHAGLYLMDNNLLLRAIGRSSAPIWFFFVGYFYQHKDGKHLYALAVLDFTAAVVFNCTNGRLGILFTVIISRFLMKIIAANKLTIQLLLVILAALVLIAPASVYFLDYGTAIMLFCLAGVMKKNKHKYYNHILIFAAVVYTLMQQAIFQFSLSYLLLWMIIFIPILYKLFNFKLKEDFEIDGNYNKSIRFLARNSLYAYFFHINFFRLFATL